MIDTKQQSFSLHFFLLCLTVVSSFTGMLVMAVPIGPIHLFPYRILLIFIWLLFVVDILKNNRRLNLSRIRVKLYLQFLFLWLSYAFFSMAWAVDTINAIRHVIFLFIGISIIFFITYYASDLNRLKQLYWLWVLIFIVLIPVGAWEVTTGNHLNISGLAEETRLRYLFAPTTVFNNQNDYAAYIALTLPMVIAWVRYCPKLSERILGAIVFSSGLWLLIQTTSRSCYIAVFLGLVFWFLFLIRWNQKIKLLTLVAFTCVFIAIVFPNQTHDTLKAVGIQVNSLAPIVLQNENDGSIDRRKNLLKNALYFVANSSGLGVGAGNVEHYMKNHSIFPVADELVNVHNWWVEILANYGIFIFTGYVIFYLSLFF